MKKLFQFIRKWKIYSLIVLLVIIFAADYAIKGLLLNSISQNRGVIVIDPGHGGVDSGANNSQIKEKDVNLDVALRLRDKLQKDGFKVIMTRTQDVALSKSKKFNRERYREDLRARLDIINNSSADIFISIHVNSSEGNASARGVMTFYYGAHPHNQPLAYVIQNIFNTSSFTYRGMEYKSYHAPGTGRYYLLVNSKIPGVIVECGFITNGTDLVLLKNPDYREYIAQSIQKGISQYFYLRDEIPENVDMRPGKSNGNMINMWEETIE